MQIEQGIATQRHRLLRLVAGLLIAVACLSAAPFSSDWRRWVSRTIFSILSKAELAAQYLVIAQAHVFARQRGVVVDPARFFDGMILSSDAPEPGLAELRRRLVALRALLRDLRHRGIRLLRRVLRGLADEAPRNEARFTTCEGDALCAWRLAANQIERPPDKDAVPSATVV